MTRCSTLSVNQRVFLAAVTRCLSISSAAKSAGINRACHPRWMRDARYSAAFGEAWEQGVVQREAAAMARAEQLAGVAA